MSERSSRFIGRRALLRGLGASALLLPLLPEAIGRSEVLGAAKRFVVFHTPNGLVQPGWYPQSSSSGFLGTIHEPLADYTSKLLLLDGIDMKSCAADPQFAANHPELYTHNLTAANMVVKDGQHYQKFWGGGPSVDQKIAAHLKALEPGLPFESFTFAIDPQHNSSQARISYREDGTTVALVDDPVDAFSQLFALSGLDAEAIARMLEQRKSMLDLVWDGELSRLRGRVGTEDRAKLDAHLDGLRALEQRLSAQAAQCKPPAIDAYADEPEYVRKGKLDMDMLAMALACGLTRVANIQWGFGTIFMSYPWAGCYSAHHDLSHGNPVGSTAEERTAESIKIGQFYASMFAHLLGRLTEYVEGEGTLLDNTLVLWTSEHGSAPDNSDGHHQERVPFLLAGNLGGSIATGQRLVFQARPHNDLFVTLCNAFGMEDVQTFGNPEVCTGALAGLFS